MDKLNHNFDMFLIMAAVTVMGAGCGGEFGTSYFEEIEGKADNAAAGPGEAPGQLLWQMDFQGLSEAPRSELKAQGFSFEKAMTDDDQILLAADQDGLSLTAKESAFGLMVMKDLRLEGAEWIEIEWGVDKFPEGADWSKGSKREAVMVYVFFGEPRSADWFYLPDSPYFIGMFLGRQEPIHTPFEGRYYRKTGRFVCLGNPEPGTVTTSRFNVGQAYEQWFKKNGIPPVTGIAVEVDTTSLSGGKSAAFISSIRIGGPAITEDIQDQT